MITFRLNSTSGLPAYFQLVQQVKHALRMGMLDVGDQLPTVKEAVTQLAINPNTVLKAYRELEYEGLIVSRPGQGTFVVRGLSGPTPAQYAALRRRLARWVEQARATGLDDESILALFGSTLQDVTMATEGVA